MLVTCDSKLSLYIYKPLRTSVIASLRLRMSCLECQYTPESWRRERHRKSKVLVLLAEIICIALVLMILVTAVYAYWELRSPIHLFSHSARDHDVHTKKN